MRQPPTAYTVNSSVSRSPSLDSEIVTGYTLQLTYQFLNGDYVAMFNIVQTATFQPFVSSSSYNAVVKALVEQLGILTCEKAKLITVNREYS